MDEQLESYIRGLLLEYVRRHITTDYVRYTQLAVAELMFLEQIPIHDPVLLTLPTDPFATLHSLWKLQDLPTYQENLSTSQDALSLIKSIITLPKGRPRSERLLWSKDSWDQIHPNLYPIEPILTRRAVRESPILGRTGGKHQAKEIKEIDVQSYRGLLNSTPIALKVVDVRPAQEPDIRKERVLDVTYRLNGSVYAAVRDLLNSISSMTRPRSPLKVETSGDYRRTYLPANFHFDVSRPTTPLPESPPLLPMFARRNRLGSDENNMEGQDKTNSSVPRSTIDLPKFIGVLQSDFPASDDDKVGESCHSLAEENMLIVDGWQTYVTSSPSNLDSDDEVDELMLPLSPDTSVSGVLDLVHDIESSKLDVVEIPRSRRIGGSSSIQEAQQTSSLGSFLLPHLGVPSRTSSGANESAGTEKESEISLITMLPEADTDANSLRGQASESSKVAHEAPSDVSGEDAELRGLYQKMSQPTGQCSSTETTSDPLAFIRDEALFDCPNNSQETHQITKNEPSLTLMPVPSLCSPTGSARLVQSYAEYIARSHRDTPKASAGGSPTSISFLKSVNGLAPLRVELSWVPFARTNPVPSHAQIVETDVLTGQEGRAVVEHDVEKLLATLSGDAGLDTNRHFKGSGFDGEKSWRGAISPDAVSFETDRSDIVLTRAERAALCKRRSGQVESEQRDTSTNKSERLHGETLNEMSAHKLGAEKRGNLGDIQDWPSKRPRQDIASSAIEVPLRNRDQGSVLEADGVDSHGNSGYNKILTSSPVDDQNLNPAVLCSDDDDDTGNDKENVPTCTSSGQAANRRYMTATSMVLDSDNIPAKQAPELDCDYNSWEDFEALPFSYDSQVCQPLSPQSCENLGTQLEHDMNQGGDGHGLIYLEQAQQEDLPRWPQRPQSEVSRLDAPRSDAVIDNPGAAKLTTDNAAHCLGVVNFANLRAKALTSGPINLPTCDLTRVFAKDTNAHVPQDSNSGLHIATTPEDLYDTQTVCLPCVWTTPVGAHRYMASLNLLQKQVLVRSLAAPECMIDLVERESLDGVDLIIDSFTAIILTSLLSLSADMKAVLSVLSEQTWRYKRILVIFEAYPTSKSYARAPRGQQIRNLAGPSREPEINAYTPPIRKAVTRFRRDLGIAQGCGKNATTCDVWYAFANTVQEAAMYARLFGDEAERADETQGVLWGPREWLDSDASEDEEDLATLRGVNRFSASIILCQMSLQQFLDTGLQERLTLFGPYIGFDVVERLSVDIDERLRMMEVSEPSDPREPSEVMPY